jgi:site-specific recombinase
VTAIGLEPELVRVYPDIERFESPFLHLNAAVLSYADSYRQALADGTALAEDDKHILVLLEQCEEILGKIRKNASRNGISVNLTYQALRLLQSLNRCAPCWPCWSRNTTRRIILPCFICWWISPGRKTASTASAMCSNPIPSCWPCR